MDTERLDIPYMDDDDIKELRDIIKDKYESGVLTASEYSKLYSIINVYCKAKELFVI